VPRSGFSYSFELECRFAAQWAGYTWEAFVELDGDQQSEVVATYQARNHIDAIVAYENYKRSKRRR
jgi:hypothetical protein